ncbi:hypothetical protein E2C01_086871 [Portunus trituberculatus]|uniref:Uncharacterized protein n=1 Tax=Portunus trituberculatus TaxID=210409 RepID=A0A5B7J1Z7_PORTR|nr:hypothetical protein [Portunus trituberculatus]
MRIRIRNLKKRRQQENKQMYHWGQLDLESSPPFPSPLHNAETLPHPTPHCHLLSIS